MAEKQYQESIKKIQKSGQETLGLMTTWAYQDDPKRLAFTFARYKFVAKMMEGFDTALEAGCGDGFVSRVVAQAVKTLVAVDFDATFIKDAQARLNPEWPIHFIHHDLLQSPVNGKFEGIYSLDVLEHIHKKDEDNFLKNILASLNQYGPLIVGMPSLESQSYASEQSRIGHINCKTQPELQKLMKKYFHNVFMFSMNDEVVHTGYHAMAHYHLALCCNKK